MIFYQTVYQQFATYYLFNSLVTRLMSSSLISWPNHFNVGEFPTNITVQRIKTLLISISSQLCVKQKLHLSVSAIVLPLVFVTVIVYLFSGFLLISLPLKVWRPNRKICESTYAAR